MLGFPVDSNKTVKPTTALTFLCIKINITVGLLHIGRTKQQSELGEGGVNVRSKSYCP